MIDKFSNYHTYKKFTDVCFYIQKRNPESPLLKEYEKKYGKFTPRKEEAWNKLNTVAGCKLVCKPM